MEKAFWPGRWCPREGGSLWESVPLKGTFTDFMQAAFKHRWVTFTLKMLKANGNLVWGNHLFMVASIKKQSFSGFVLRAVCFWLCCSVINNVSDVRLQHMLICRLLIAHCCTALLSCSQKDATLMAFKKESKGNCLTWNKSTNAEATNLFVAFCSLDGVFLMTLLSKCHISGVARGYKLRGF